MKCSDFVRRHIGPSPEDVKKMLQIIGLQSIDELMEKTIPDSIRSHEELDLPDGMTEDEVVNLLREIGRKNKQYRSFIGMGYYNTITPPVIQRNILENPGWYTAYTPYQAEISQGRLEALLVFQTMVSDLMGLPVSNASLLDEATAAAEAMTMAFNARTREKQNARTILVSETIFPQTLDVILTRAEPLGITVKILPFDQFQFDDTVFAAMVQYPDAYGEIHDYKNLADNAHQHKALFIAISDILAVTILKPPGEWGADIAVGSTQRFGVPMGFGGPHAAFLATTEDLKRFVPGRIIGVSIDKYGQKALRMALQTREQHIKRERATSNICTAQALLAIMAAMYAVYHGPEKLKEIAKRVHSFTSHLAEEVQKYGYHLLNKNYFDTICFEVPEHITTEIVRQRAEEAKMNFRYIDQKKFGLSFDETVTINDINNILCVLATAAGQVCTPFSCAKDLCLNKQTFDTSFERQSDFMTHPLFHSYHSETAMMRYLKKLENRDLALNRTMIPLGSCTMKLNAAVELFHLSWPEYANIHPYVPQDQAEGYMYLIKDFEQILCKITGFDKVSFQPNSGAAGEYAGLMVIRAYHKANGQAHRNVCLIPSSAHGTNPASAAMAGMKVVVVKCDEKGNIDVQDVRQKAEQYRDQLAALMVTYPSTHGVFEEDILQITQIVHECGGLVYMDGANMNAQVGYTNPAILGADVCHLNLHKTFAIPHGGGGPGMGPICVTAKLAPYLPSHFIEKHRIATGAVSAAPYGSPFIIPISYAYCKLMGKNGLKYATEIAILNANYLRVRLQEYYSVLYTGKNGFVAHEMILDCNGFKKLAHIDAIDIAKRLIDYGFHAPTVAFPVIGTLMVEPTESEPLEELDRFVDAMISIRKEIDEVMQGVYPVENNVVKNAPHILKELISDDWKYPYSKQKAFMPVQMTDKYFPPVARIDDAYGDRNLICTCPPIEDYMG